MLPPKSIGRCYTRFARRLATLAATPTLVALVRFCLPALTGVSDIASVSEATGTVAFALSGADSAVFCRTCAAFSKAPVVAEGIVFPRAVFAARRFGRASAIATGSALTGAASDEVATTAAAFEALRLLGAALTGSADAAIAGVGCFSTLAAARL